jgi:hypothetical protein
MSAIQEYDTIRLVGRTFVNLFDTFSTRRGPQSSNIEIRPDERDGLHNQNEEGMDTNMKMGIQNKQTDNE